MNALVKSAEWHDEHRRTIGGSIAAACLGEHPYITPAQAYDYLRGDLPPAELTADMERGTLMEHIARAKLAAHLNTGIADHDQNEFIYNPTYPFAHSLPDGWVGAVIPTELKVPRVRNWHRLRMYGLHAYWIVQCQHTLAVTGAPYIEFGALNPETLDVLHLTVQRDDALIDTIMQREADFMESVRHGLRPVEHVERIELPEYTGEIIRIDNDAAAAAARALMEATALRLEAEELEESAKARIKELIGDAQACELPGLRVYHRMQKGRVTFDKAKLKKAHPEIDLSAFEKEGAPFRTFKHYRLGQ